MPGSSQLQARGIYLDPLTDAQLSHVTALINAGEDWLPDVPFYEINLTLLAEWSADVPAVATVTSEAKQTIVDPLNSYYGTYSRGRLDVVADSGQSVITVQAKRGSSGITGSEATDPDDRALLLSDSITVTSTGSDVFTSYFALTGEINCLDKRGSSCNKNALNGINLSLSVSGVSCTVNTGQGQQTPFYTCPGIIEGSSGFLTVSKNGYAFTPVIILFVDIGANRVQDILMVEF